MKAGAPLLGVFGGTFDPIHQGHLCTARVVSKRLQLDRLHIIPAVRPPLKPATGADSEQRLQMLQLALTEYHEFYLDLCEYRRTGPSYTTTTLRNLRQRYPQHHLVLIIGADTFAGLSDWHQHKALSKLTHLAVMSRRSTPTPTLLTEGFTAINREQLKQQNTGGLLAVEVPSPDISSTFIRAGITTGKDVSSMLCPAVWDYIQQHRLYGCNAIGSGPPEKPVSEQAPEVTATGARRLE
ncbi:MAG TPA: nicotinate-nucleotide adenylyltransferase [Gammaproteobacteria bacterium]|nr:nicotinate-nucleotide adenylyltransferase [Gammaproteobacteria bacterium]